MVVRRLITAVALGIALLGASLTTAAGSPTTTLPPSTITLENGGTVTVAISRFPSEFNPSTPAGANPTTEMVMAQVWPQTFVTDDSSNVVAYPPSGTLGVIDSAEVTSVSPETVVYQIDPKAVWSDGTAITAADFTYNWQQALIYGPNMPATYPLSGYEAISSIVSSHRGKTATVTFDKPYADWEDLFSYLVPAHIGERDGFARAFGRFSQADLVSGGPFVITKVVPGRTIVLGRNPRWWGPPAHLARIIFVVEKGDSATIAALQSGRVDVAALDPSPALSRLLVDDASLGSQVVLSPVLWQLAFNTASPMMSDLVLRQAVANAIDRTQLVESSVGLYDNTSSAAGNHLYLAGALGYLTNDTHGPVTGASGALARQSLAGYAMDSSGYLVSASGKPLTLTLVGPSGSALVGKVEQVLQSELLQSGIVLRIKNVRYDTLLSKVLTSGNYEIALAPYKLSSFPSTTEVLYLPSASSATSAATSAPLVGKVTNTDSTVAEAVTRDVVRYSDPTIGALFRQASEQLNATAAAALYNKIDTALWTSLPTLPLFQMPSVVVTHSGIANVTLSVGSAGLAWDAQLWGYEIATPPSTTTTTSLP